MTNLPRIKAIGFISGAAIVLVVLGLLATPLPLAMPGRAGASDSWTVNRLLPWRYTSGQEVLVTLCNLPCPGEGDLYETIPAGWSLVTANLWPTDFDEGTGTIHWSWDFFAGCWDWFSFSYIVLPPVGFKGDASFEGYFYRPGDPNDWPPIPELDIPIAGDTVTYDHPSVSIVWDTGRSGVEVSWSSRAGRSYSLLFSEDFERWYAAALAVPSGGLRTIWVDTIGWPPTVPMRFYRVKENP